MLTMMYYVNKLRHVDFIYVLYIIQAQTGKTNTDIAIIVSFTLHRTCDQMTMCNESL